MDKQKAIIIGASSGIGKALALLLSKHGYEVGLCARRLPLLIELKEQLPGRSYIREMDIADPDKATAALDDLIREMNGLDLVIISAGTGFENPELEWDKENITIQTNVSGFSAVCLAAYRYLAKKNSGHIVGISSIAALRGMSIAPSYSASKAYVSNFLQGLHYRSIRSKKNVCVTNIEPGFVDTAMAKGEGLFWVASPSIAAEQIFKAIEKKRRHAYVTRRWRLIAWLMKIVPDTIYARFG